MDWDDFLKMCGELILADQRLPGSGLPPCTVGVCVTLHCLICLFHPVPAVFVGGCPS